MTRRIAAAVAVAALVVLGAPAHAADDPGAPPTDPPTETPPGTPAETPTDEPTEAPGDTVDDAVLRWGLNVESNTSAFAPGTYNFFSAGLVPDPGRGGQTIDRSDWSASAGEVAVEKWDGARWRPATWSGLSTDADGEPLRHGTSSGHTFAFGGGEGAVDAAAGTAHLAWDGDVTVLYYSGMSMFHLSDPVLDVADGAGVVTATMSGYASSVDDPSSWEPVPARTVTVATLPDVDLGADGFVATPAYRGVRVAAANPAQVRDGADWGAFPASWVEYADRLGTSSFWYSSGGIADPYKVASDLGVGWDGAEQPGPSAPPGPTDPDVDNDAPSAPTTPATPPGVAVPTSPGSAPGAAAGAATETPFSVADRPGTEVRLLSSPSAGPTASPARAWPWWAGGALLLLAAALLLRPPLLLRPARARRT